MSRVLRGLAQRSCAFLDSDLAGGAAKQSATASPTDVMNELRFLAVSCNALCSLAGISGRDRDADFIMAAAASTTGHVAAAFAALPVTKDVDPKVMSTAFRIAKKSARLVHPRVTGGLLRELDARVNPAVFPLWGPHQQLQALHTIAKAASASGGAAAPLPMVDDLLLCLGRELGTLSHAEAALLLWCLATLRLQDAPLWPAACRRCTFLLARMNHVSQSTVLYAALISENCADSAQQELMNALVTVSPGGSSSSGSRRHSDSSSFGGSGEALRDDDSGGGDFYAAIRGRLLRSAHALSTDVLFALLRQLQKISTTNHSGGGDDGDEASDTASLLSQLSKRRDLTGEQAVTALSEIVLPQLAAADATESTRGSPSAPSGLDSPSAAGSASPLQGVISDDLFFDQRHLASVLAAAVAALVASSPSQCPHPSEVLRCLCASPVVDPLRYGLPELSPQQRRELGEAVMGYTEEAMRRGRSTFAAIDGETLFSAAVAADAIGLLFKIDGAPAELPLLLSQVASAVEESQSAWRQRGEPARLTQTTAVLCASSSSSATGAGATAGLLAQSLVGKCIDSLLAAPRLPLDLITQLLTSTTGERAPSPAAQALQKRLLLLLDTSAASTPRATLLAAVGSLLPQCGPSAPMPGSPSAPDALLDLFIRLLQQDGAPALVPLREAEVLVAALERRGRVGGPVELERGFMMLCTRRFGQRQSFLKAAQLPPGALVALIHLADALCDDSSGMRDGSTSTSSAAALSLQAGAGATILATLIEHIVPSESGGGAVAQCRSVAALNDVASLLALPACASLDITTILAGAVTQQGIVLAQKKTAASREKALLVAHLFNAGADISEELLAALRST